MTQTFGRAALGVATLGLVVWAAGGCGSKDDGKKPATTTATPPPPSPPKGAPQGTTVDRFCNQPGKGRCTSSRLAVGYEAERAELDCGQDGGTWSTTPCATRNIVGRCVAASRLSTTFYSPPAWTEASAGATCAAPATWKPGVN